MFGLFGLRSRLPLIAGIFLAVAAVLGAVYYWSPHATLRFTTGPEGGVANRFMSTFISLSTAEHPRIHFETVTVPDLRASAKALEDGKADIALVRSDLPPPANGETLVILRRDAVAIVVSPESPVDNVAKLAGKTVAIPTGPVQDENSRALDLILGYFNIPDGIGEARFSSDGRDRRRHPSQARGGCIGGRPDRTRTSRRCRGRHRQGDQRETANCGNRRRRRHCRALSRLRVRSTFPRAPSRRIRPSPTIQVTTVAVTYRFAVPATMLKPVAGAIARSILKAKARLMAASPLASQIEAPDPDEKNPALPIHPGVADYLSSGDQSFIDDFQSLFYLFGIPLSLGASLVALIAGHFSKKKLQQDQQDIFQLLTIAEEANKADASELAELERTFAATVQSCISKLVEGANAADQAPMSLAIEHARRAIQARKMALAKQITSAA